jgi:uronate dehydrogenase
MEMPVTQSDAPPQQRILITGGAGKIAALLRPRLARPGRVVRLLDIRPPAQLGPVAVGVAQEEVVSASVDDLDAVVEACGGVDAVVHLGGHGHEAPPEDVLRLNAYGTWCVLEASRRAGVGRVILASSSHVAGFQDLRDVPAGGLPADCPARPDTLYGWSKVAAEAAGRLYADRFGMDVLCLRIGMWFGTPPGLRGLAMWLSPDDGARLVEACVAAPSPGFRLVWGISRNTRRWGSLAEGEALGYHPRDDAEFYFDALTAKHGEPDFANDPLLTRIGGSWCDLPLGVAF